MGLFKERFCVQCGKKAGLLTRTKLADGNFLCSDCAVEVPSEYFHLSKYTYEEYKALMEYVNYSKNELSKIFTLSHEFHGVNLDSEHGIFYLDGGFFSTPFYFELKNLGDFDMVFAPEELKEGILGDKVKGKILFRFTMNYPYCYREKIIATDVKAKAKKNFFGTKIQYENPKGMDEFLLFFASAWGNAAADTQDNDTSSNASELQQAMALFMIDDLAAVTTDDIKQMRNRLLSTFHPDKSSAADTKAAQKINAAYQLLKTSKEME